MIKYTKINEIVMIENVVKTIGGSKICRRQSYNNKRPNLGRIVFLGRETELCQNRYQSRVPVTDEGSKGSTIIFFK